ncbi:aldose 1-epimerase family protein [Roseomonas nepalensis]|uniref:Aldose 1-epimerase family protein n=1 Tax=Muricoccus nepalensis TaxID=1854500 RepID=A0A502GF68_9PROT|nr:aldose 1-epimerase family protein [Roseomonas nepalensis]TPG60252.1 aldose 1-epimerase family protein [Roseomonas nepalensis]
MTDTHRFGDSRLAATVSAAGAELSSVRDGAGGEWLWQAGPAWPRHAPVLFPLVGRLPGDVLRHGGREHRLTQHGFARDRAFTWRARGEAGCALRLVDDEATRAAYPFPFVLDLEWAVADGTLSCTATVSNPGAAPLPFSLGAHPAFAWPLPGAASAEGHAVRFPGLDLPALSARRLSGGLLDATETIPLAGGSLPLHQGLFDADAIVLPDFSGRRLRYEGPGAALEMGWEGYGDLGLWSKPGGAAFLCLEPWSGTTPPLGWDGDFAGKPGITLLEPGASRAFRWWIRPERA